MKQSKKLLALSLISLSVQHAYAGLSISDTPVALGGNVAPLNMLVMNRDHTLFYEAYNDASDLTGDGIPEIGYMPKTIDYYGYFDNNKCYDYDTTNKYFYPVAQGTRMSGGTDAYKVCSGKWSGDFLNYTTMSKIDIIRKVLFGGKRSKDTASETVLERAYIPQDAHSWGKEYISEAVNGYKLSDFTPLSSLEGQEYNTDTLNTLFANTTLGGSNSTNAPLLRVLTKTKYHLNHWVTKGSPVAGNDIGGGSNNLTSSFNWGTLPTAVSTSTSELTTYWNNGTTNTSTANPALTVSNNIADENNSDNKLSRFTFPNTTKGSRTLTIKLTSTEGSPYVAILDANGNYLTSKKINVGQNISYDVVLAKNTSGSFIIDGNSKVKVEIKTSSNSASELNDVYSGIRYTTKTKAVTTNTITPILTEYEVRVKACVVDSSKSLLPEEGCKTYGTTSSPIYKPAGILQSYGEENSVTKESKMKFGLMTGGFKNNLDFGTLRKNIATLGDEIENTNGTFKSTNGIIKMLSNLQPDGFGRSSLEWSYCNLNNLQTYLTQNKLINNKCGSWGAPTGEIMHEALLYFQGDISKKSTSETDTLDKSDGTSSTDADVVRRNWINTVAWTDPYATNSGNLSCAKPFMTVIADTTPTFDSDTPSSPWSNDITTKKESKLTGLTSTKYSQLGASMWENEFKGAKKVVIGEVKYPVTGEISDGTPTAKTANNFADIRGIAPLRPTQEGSYASSIVANFARSVGVVNSLNKNVKVNTLAITFPSHLPTFEIPVNGKKIVITPFGKSVGQYGINKTQGRFQPTNTIVDFYMTKMVNIKDVAGNKIGTQDASVNGGLPYYKFRIAYEDVEAGQDHELDSLVEYTVWITKSGNTEKLNVKAESIEASAGIIMHHGYTVQGSTADGLYLVVRQFDKTAETDANYQYFMDRKDNRVGGVSGGLPLVDTRVFDSANSEVTTLKDPMYYAAKYGGYLGADTLTKDEQWDLDGDTVPDTYFYATNPSELDAQLKNAFSNITKRLSAASAVATSSTSLNNGLRIYQATFNSGDWSGDLFSLPVESSEVKDADWAISNKLAQQTSRNVYTSRDDTGAGIHFVYDNLSANQKSALNVTPGTSTVDNLGAERVSYLKGDQSKEVTTFRARKVLLGDIVNSAPTYVGAPSDIWTDLAYTNFKTKFKDRKEMLYLGANDGMLHGFDASLTSDNKPTTTSGKEVFAYVPSESTLFNNLSQLTSKSYGTNPTHLYYVDGTPVTRDVKMPTSACANDDLVKNAKKEDICYRTMLVGGLNAGGKGYYALDVTDPTTFNDPSKVVKWEFSANTILDAADKEALNYTYGRPFIIHGNDGDAWALVSNGLAKGVTSSDGYIFALRMSGPTGANKTWIKNRDYVAIPLGKNTDGAGEISCADIGKRTLKDGVEYLTPALDQNSDVCYVGDPKGNLWRVNLTSADPTKWKVDTTNSVSNVISNQPIFTTYTSSSDIGTKPILSAPELTYFPYGKAVNGEAYKNLLVYVGTGKYLGTDDKQSVATQGVYTVWDDNKPNDPLLPNYNANYTPLTKSNLEPRTIKNDDPEKGLRSISGNEICWNGLCKDTQGNIIAGDYGWYNEYPSQGANPAERFVGTLQLYGRNLYFNSLIPSTDPCEFGGTGWLMAVDYLTGLTPTTRIFDTNNDNLIDSADKKSVGKKIGGSIGGSTLVKPIDKNKNAIAITSLLSGDLQVTTVNGKAKQERVLSWKELYQDKLFE